MQRYKNATKSGVQFFKSGKDFIELLFEDGGKYLYKAEKPGKQQVDEMKKLAVSGVGLNTYVNKHVGENFAEKLN